MATRRCVVLALAAVVLLRRLWYRLGVRAVTLHVQQTGITVGALWFVIVPLLMWTIAAVYVPLLAPFLRPLAKWGVALATTLLLGASLLGHVLAHLGMAKALRSRVPERVPLYPFGDAAQVWPTARTPWHEAVIALSGPLFNVVIAYVSYWAWDRQLHVGSNVALPLVAGVNLVIAVLNMAPGFPLDGGRLARAAMWGLLGRPALAGRLGRWLGYGIGCALGCWGLLLVAQRARFSEVTGLSTLGFAMLLLWALWRHRNGHAPYASRRTFSPYSIRGLTTGVLLLALLAIGSSLVPTTHAIRMPGGAVPIEPMVTVPLAYRHPLSGSFLMTTVFDQTPIVAGQWVYAQFDPASYIIAPERIVPPTTTPQAHVWRSYQLLEQSERTATIVASRLAGHHTMVQGTVIEVVDVRPDSWASPSFQPGDRILRFNGTPLLDSTDLFAQLHALDPATSINVELVRNSTLLHLDQAFVPGTDPVAPTDIVLRAAEPYTDAPFAVTITPHKIVGGPSVGLMFTLTVYDLLTPEDLTNGRRIAGTGTIDFDGNVGPIGGVAQKVAAAEAAGADYFLVPVANADDARSVARRIQVVEVATVEQAIEILRTLQPVESQS